MEVVQTIRLSYLLYYCIKYGMFHPAITEGLLRVCYSISYSVYLIVHSANNNSSNNNKHWHSKCRASLKEYTSDWYAWCRKLCCWIYFSKTSSWLFTHHDVPCACSDFLCVKQQQSRGNRDHHCVLTILYTSA